MGIEDYKDEVANVDVIIETHRRDKKCPLWRGCCHNGSWKECMDLDEETKDFTMKHSSGCAYLRS